MRLLKIICVVFLIYFIRRFIQMYKVMKRIQEEQANLRNQTQETYQNPPRQTQGEVINADFKVVD